MMSTLAADVEELGNNAAPHICTRDDEHDEVAADDAVAGAICHAGSPGGKGESQI